MKILVIDDSRFVRKQIIKFLDDFSASIYEAADGQEALDVHKVQQVDLILTDWNMPVKTGLELVQELKEGHVERDPPILMITTNNQQDAIVAAIEAGCDDFLMKPFDREDLHLKLRSMLGDDHPIFGGCHA
ncbi:MAG: response regulator [Vulcanimicrobiota bacterium]